MSEKYLGENSTPILINQVKDKLEENYKVMGQLGAKNLLVYPFYETTKTTNGITFTVNTDNSVNIDGISTNYAVFFYERTLEAYNKGQYILSVAEDLPSGVVVQFGYYTDNTFTEKGQINNTHKSILIEVTDEFDTHPISIRITVNPNITLNNFVVHSMLRHASDTDNTWQPYAKTNYELTQDIDILQDTPIKKGVGTNSIIECNLINNTANGINSHAEGNGTSATGNYSHAEGSACGSRGNYSHAQNRSTMAQGISQTVLGEYNIQQGSVNSRTDTDHALIIGNGTDNEHRSNALAVQWDGTVVFQDGSKQNSSPYAIMGKLGAKNLIKYPYHDPTMVSAGITFTDNKDGSVTLNGTSTSYSAYLFVLREYNLEPGVYILSCAETLPQGITVECGEANTLDSRGITTRYAQVKLDEHEARFNVPSNTRNFAVRIQFNPNITVDNLTLHVMIRFGTDTDSTWHPYALTNYELGEQIKSIENEFDYPPIKGVTCWGDSLTVDSQGWVKILGELSGIPTYNAGTGGENVYTITARQGADVMMINNITIPATTTPVLIATRAEGGIDTYFGGKALPDLQPNSCLNPVRIGNIEGQLRWTGSAHDDQNGTWTFTRATAGDEVVIDRPTAIRTNYDVIHNNTNELMIIYMGTNHGYADIEDLINKHRLMIDHFKGKEYLVLGFSYGDSQSQADYEAAMKEAFGRRFVSLRQYLAHPIYENGDIVSCYGLADQGLTPTETSLQEIARGAVPKQILRDNVHYTQGTHEVIANMLYKKLKELNIL